MRALLALLALGVLLTAHELAHLLAARVFGTRAIVFSFGIGPPLFDFRALGQRWALGAIPFGGWLRLEGENPHDAMRASGVPFAALSVGRRLAIFAAGPLGSWALAVLLPIGGQACQLQLVDIHLDATTASLDPTRFNGQIRIITSTPRPETCVCQAWFEYQASLSNSQSICP